MSIIESDRQTIDAIAAIQNAAGGVPAPLIGCVLIDGAYVPRDKLTPEQIARVRQQCPSFDPHVWRGTRNVHAVEQTETGARLELTADTEERIAKARAKKASDRTPDEKKLAAVTVKDKHNEAPRGAGEVNRG